MTKDLVLVGGGHAHVHVLKTLGMRPIEGARVTLVTRDVATIYSGMVPGRIAGHYTDEECHIDLWRLARFSGARLIHAEVVGIDAAEKRVLLKGRPPIRYDILSLDIGATARSAVSGVLKHTTPVRPIESFLKRWDEISRMALMRPRFHIVVIGGGAGGVELLLSAQRRLQSLKTTRESRTQADFTLITRGKLLKGHNGSVRRSFMRILAERGVKVLTDSEVIRLELNKVLCGDGREISFDEAFWVTGAGAASWLAGSGLKLDGDGFIAVDETLRSLSHPDVFAAGDVATMIDHPRPKAGVYAVRQGPPLADNLRRAVKVRPLRSFVPQRKALALIGTGDRYAVASRGAVSFRGRWVWSVKEWIDRRWIAGYQDLPGMIPEGMAAQHASSADSPADLMRCAGCGAKVPASSLSTVMARLGIVSDPDDAALMTAPRDATMLQTVDFFRSFVSDPYLFGRIAANHALGDIYAMGGLPSSALAIAGVPHGPDTLVEEDLYQMLRGALDILEQAGASLAGGHTAETAELMLGFAVTGRVSPGRVLRKGGLRPEDHLILTKPLGTGTILAAEMRGEAKARWIDEALGIMDQPANAAAQCLLDHEASAATDVTGFGLLGHLLEMLEASAMAATIDLDRVPALEGALETIGKGIVSTLHPANSGRSGSIQANVAPSDPRLALLYDPQTAGGLLAGVPAERAPACVSALQALGFPEARDIGVVHVPQDGGSRVIVRAP